VISSNTNNREELYEVPHFRMDFKDISPIAKNSEKLRDFY
jgi:hypothetical protein